MSSEATEEEPPVVEEVVRVARARKKTEERGYIRQGPFLEHLQGGAIFCPTPQRLSSHPRRWS